VHDSRQPLNHDVTIGNVQKLARVSLRYGQKFLTDRGENESRLVGDQLASRYRELHPECFLASPLGVFAGLGLLDLGCGQPLVEFELRRSPSSGTGGIFGLSFMGWSHIDSKFGRKLTRIRASQRRGPCAVVHSTFWKRTNSHRRTNRRERSRSNRFPSHETMLRAPSGIDIPGKS
jgi:hypothetical protein